MIITALAVLVAVAGYLNFTGQEIDKNGLKSVMSLSGKATAAPADTTQETKQKEKQAAKADAKDSAGKAVNAEKSSKKDVQ